MAKPPSCDTRHRPSGYFFICEMFRCLKNLVYTYLVNMFVKQKDIHLVPIHSNHLTHSPILGIFDTANDSKPFPVCMKLDFNTHKLSLSPWFRPIKRFFPSNHRTQKYPSIQQSIVLGRALDNITTPICAECRTYAYARILTFSDPQLYSLYISI